MNMYQVALRKQQGLLVHGRVGVGSWQTVACQVEFDEESGGFWSFSLYLPRWEKLCFGRKVKGTLHFLRPSEVAFHDYHLSASSSRQ